MKKVQLLIWFVYKSIYYQRNKGIGAPVLLTKYHADFWLTITLLPFLVFMINRELLFDNGLFTYYSLFPCLIFGLFFVFVSWQSISDSFNRNTFFLLFPISKTQAKILESVQMLLGPMLLTVPVSVGLLLLPEAVKLLVDVKGQVFFAINTVLLYVVGTLLFLNLRPLLEGKQNNPKINITAFGQRLLGSAIFMAGFYLISKIGERAELMFGTGSGQVVVTIAAILGGAFLGFKFVNKP